MNQLYFGDNLDVLRRYIKDETVDLVYLDPPFNSNTTYNVLFAEKNGSQAAAQIKAFEDTWHWDQKAAESYQEVVETGGKVSQVMQAFHTFLGDNDMLAYLAMMAPRLMELRRVLKETGSIYLHCDPTASHYLKLLMDSIFGAGCFQNEVVWHYRRWTGKANRFQRLHDIIFFFTKGDKNTFNIPYTAYTEKSLYRKQWYHTRIKGNDIYETKIDERGVRMGDVWDIPVINSQAKERLGYPTQKPEALLERIIEASSNEGAVVLDPFCGCGTTISAAEKLKRNWIGIDITHLAINLIKHRLKDSYGKQVNYEVIGEPISLSGAEELAKQDKYQFQWWALGLVGARPVEEKKGADKGIDGRLYFHDDKSGKTKQIIFSVKGGENVSVKDLRDIRGVLDREKAEIGVLICLADPTKPMRVEAAGAGFYDSPLGKKYPHLQILTIAELLNGKKVDYPPSELSVTFKRAPKPKPEEKKTLVLPFGD